MPHSSYLYQPVCHLVFKEPASYVRGKGSTETYTKTITADVRLYIPNVESVDIIKMANNKIEWKNVVEQIYSRTKYISNNLTPTTATTGRSNY